MQRCDDRLNPNPGGAEHREVSEEHPLGLSIDERDGLVIEHLELVGRVVSEVAARYPRHVDRGELWNAGALGLVEASRRFDPETGIPFRRYAAIRIRGAIIDSTRTRDWASRSVRRKLREVNHARSGLEARLGRAPTPDEIAEFLGVPVSELHRRLTGAAHSSVLQLDQPIGDEEDMSLGDLVSHPGLTPDESIEQRELRGALAEAIRRLPPAQSEVISRSFLAGELLADIAEDLGLTEARLSQIRSEAIEALRSYFATQYEGLVEADELAPGKRARADFLKRMASETTWKSRLRAADQIPEDFDLG